MEVCRTIPVKLNVADRDADLLCETIQQFLDAANFVVEAAYDGESVPNPQVRPARRDVLRGTRANSVTQQPRSVGARPCRGCTQKRRGEVVEGALFGASDVHHAARGIQPAQRDVPRGRRFLSTVDGRVTVEYVLPDEDRDTPHAEYLFGDEYETTGATLHYRNGEFYLHVRTKADVDAPDHPENGTVLGVDLGIENIAVTSTGTFWSADELDHWRTEYVERRRSLQECGTRWAHENVQSVGRKETERFEQYLHRVANELVAEAVENGCSYIAFERLTNIRERMPRTRKFHEWALHQLFGYVEYKAEARGISVEQVNPAHTSQRCSTCGFTVKANRDRESFACQSCGYENHADYNAAKNIGLKLLRSQTGTEGGAPVGVRLNSRILNTSGLTSAPAVSV